MRIHELAKKYNVSSEELIALLKNSGHDVANHMSAVDYDMLAALDRHFSWANTSAKKPARKTAARSKAAKATETAAPAAARAKVKLVKAKTVEPAPVEGPVAEEKAKVKLAKAKTAEAAPARAEVKEGAAAGTKKAAAKAEAKAPAKKAEEPKKPPKAPRVKTPSPLDELSKGAPEPIIAVEPDLGIDEPQWRGRIIEEPRRHAREAEQVRESVRRRIAEMETTRKTKRRKTRVAQAEPAELPPIRVQEGVTPIGLAEALEIGVDDLPRAAELTDLAALADTLETIVPA